MSSTPTIQPPALAHLLGGWNQTPGPLKRRLPHALRTAIERGAIPSGVRLPAERSLASELGISRGTVVAAYASLRDDALVASRQGSGTWVPERDLAARDMRSSALRFGVETVAPSARRSA